MTSNSNVEPTEDRAGKPPKRAGMRRGLRAAAVGGLAATFVVALAFAPRFAGSHHEVTVQNTATEAPPVDATASTVVEATTTITKAPTTTTTEAPTTTTTVHVVTTTTAPTTTTTLVTSDPAVRMQYVPDPAGTAFTGTLVTRHGWRPNLTVQLQMVPFYPGWGGNSGADPTKAKTYIFTFPAEATSVPVSIPKSDWSDGDQITYFSPLIDSYTWDGGQHGPVNSTTMAQEGI